MPTTFPTRRTRRRSSAPSWIGARSPTGEHARLLGFYRDLIALRRSEPDLADPWLEHLAVDYDEELGLDHAVPRPVRIACNLGAEPATVPVSGEVVLAWGEPTVGADSTMLEGHSVAILRQGPA